MIWPGGTPLTAGLLAAGRGEVGRLARAIPKMARLLASVPPLVKISRSRRGGARSAPRICGNLLAGVFQRPPGLLAGPMLAGRVGINSAIAPGHRFHHFRPGRRSRIMVEIDGFHEPNCTRCRGRRCTAATTRGGHRQRVGLCGSRVGRCWTGPNRKVSGVPGTPAPVGRQPGRDRQLDRDLRPAADFALQADLAAVGLDDLPRGRAVPRPDPPRFVEKKVSNTRARVSSSMPRPVSIKSRATPSAVP